MLIQTVTLQAGPNGVVEVGTKLDLPAEDAKRLIAAGAAVCIDPPDNRTTTEGGYAETAMLTPPETRTEPRKGKR